MHWSLAFRQAGKKKSYDTNHIPWLQAKVWIELSFDPIAFMTIFSNDARDTDRRIWTWSTGSTFSEVIGRVPS